MDMNGNKVSFKPYVEEKIILKRYTRGGHKPVQSQQNNVRKQGELNVVWFT